jgi:hypothetical protein
MLPAGGQSAACVGTWFFLKIEFLMSYKSDQKFQAVSTMFHRITLGLKGGILRVLVFIKKKQSKA